MAYRGRTGYEEGHMQQQYNDGKVDDLQHKVSALKRITLDIGEEVRSQNRLLNDMDTEFESGKGILQNTMRRLGIVGKSGGKNLIFYLLGFSLFVFFVIYLLAKRG
ncbi:unnamed protein product, partial [Mesorhabditis spiculigera]